MRVALSIAVVMLLSLATWVFFYVHPVPDPLDVPSAFVVVLFWFVIVHAARLLLRRTRGHGVPDE